jgi:ParB-like nuclease family protein
MQSGALDGLDHDGGEAVLKPESFPIDKIYVPVKRRKTLKPEVVQEIAESMLEIGQQTPILVRPDEGRLVLIEGLHRLEACKALGEGAIIALLVSAEEAHQKTDPGLVAEREKMERLRKLRLEKEAAEKLATAPKAALPTEGVLRQREQPTTTRNNPKTRSSQSGRGVQGSVPTTLSDWIKQQERNGGRY